MGSSRQASSVTLWGPRGRDGCDPLRIVLDLGEAHHGVGAGARSQFLNEAREDAVMIPFAALPLPRHSPPI